VAMGVVYRGSKFFLQGVLVLIGGIFLWISPSYKFQAPTQINWDFSIICRSAILYLGYTVPIMAMDNSLGESNFLILVDLIGMYVLSRRKGPQTGVSQIFFGILLLISGKSLSYKLLLLGTGIWNYWENYSNYVENYHSFLVGNFLGKTLTMIYPTAGFGYIIIVYLVWEILAFHKSAYKLSFSSSCS